jgi:hypothetical protein
MESKKKGPTQSAAGGGHKADTHGPKRDLEKAEKQLQLMKKETEKTFE